jgi:hypothetical protein
MKLQIAYAQIQDLEYGQKAGRRVGAVGTSVLLGPIGLVTLFSKKRKHYLTIGYKDAEGFDQVAVIELGKDLVRTTLAVVETRSGKKIESSTVRRQKTIAYSELVQKIKVLDLQARSSVVRNITVRANPHDH